MSEHKLVPFEPTPEMIEAAEDAHMPFGDMDLALRMAVLAAPAVQGEPVAWQRVDRPERIVTKLYRRTVAEVDGGVEFIPLYATPQHAPEVAALVDALEEIVKQYPNPNISHQDFRVHACRHAETALAAHRKQGGGE